MSGQRGRTRSWKYRGITLHCHLFFLGENSNSFPASSPSPTSTSSSTSNCDASGMTSKSLQWRKVEVIDIQAPHDVKVHFVGMSSGVRSNPLFLCYLPILCFPVFLFFLFFSFFYFSLFSVFFILFCFSLLSFFLFSFFIHYFYLY